MHTLFALAAVSLLSSNPAVLESDPVYLAVCREVPERVFPKNIGMRIELLGSLEHGSLMAVDLGTVAAPEPIARRIPGLEWHFLAPDGAAGRTERFGDARLVYGWNEPEEDGEAPEIGEDESLLVLGACDFPGTIYATSALSFPQQGNASPREDRRVREEIERLGASRAVEVERIGDAVIAKATVHPHAAVLDAAIGAYPESMRELISTSIRREPIDVFTVVHPGVKEPITVGEHRGDRATFVRLSAVVRVAGEDLAIVVSTHDAFEGGYGDQASVINLRTGESFTVTLMGSGC